MKIAFVLGNFDRARGGAERYIVGLAGYLAERGHAVHVISMSCAELPKGAQWRKITVAGAGAARLRRFSSLSEALLRAESWDVIQGFEKTLYMDVFQPHSGVHRAAVTRNLRATRGALGRALRRLGKRWSARERFFVETEDALYSRTPLPMFVALSRMVHRDMRDTYRIPEDRIRLIYNGTDPRAFHPGRRDKARWRIRAEHAIGDSRVFLFVSHDHRRKGLASLLDAAARLDRARDFRVVVAGRDAVGAYRRQAARLGIPERVLFAGDQTDIRDWYAAADVFVLPTYYDPCALTVFEALASGVPVITTSHNGAGEILTSGEQGVIVRDAEAVDELADAMGVYFDGAELERQSLAARRLAEQYPIDKSYAAMLALYEEIAARKTAPAGSPA